MQLQDQWWRFKETVFGSEWGFLGCGTYFSLEHAARKDF